MVPGSTICAHRPLLRVALNAEPAQFSFDSAASAGCDMIDCMTLMPATVRFKIPGICESRVDQRSCADRHVRSLTLPRERGPQFIEVDRAPMPVGDATECGTKRNEIRICLAAISPPEPSSSTKLDAYGPRWVHRYSSASIPARSWSSGGQRKRPLSLNRFHSRVS